MTNHKALMSSSCSTRDYSRARRMIMTHTKSTTKHLILSTNKKFLPWNIISFSEQNLYQSVINILGEKMIFRSLFLFCLTFFSLISNLKFLKYLLPIQRSQNKPANCKRWTVPTHNKHTPNKHFSHNKQTLFALTKMCLFGEMEDFGKMNSLYFLS